MAAFGRDTSRSEPAAESLRVDLDLVLLFQSLGKMIVVVLGESSLVQFQHTLAEAFWFGVVRLAAAVAVADSGIARGPDLGLKPEDLAGAQVQHRGRGPRRQAGECLMDNREPSHFRLREAQLFRHASRIASIIKTP